MMKPDIDKYQDAEDLKKYEQTPITKTSVILRSIVKSVFSGLKSFLKDFGEPGMIQQARVGRAMGIVRDHRKEQIKNATYSNTIEDCQRQLQQLQMKRQIDEEKMRELWDKISELQTEVNK